MGDDYSKTKNGSIQGKGHISLKEATRRPTEIMKFRRQWDGIFRKSVRKQLSDYNSNTGKISFKNKSENTFSWKQKPKESVTHISALKEIKREKKTFRQEGGGNAP